MAVDNDTALAGGRALESILSVPTEVIGGVRVATLSRRQTARLMIDMALAARDCGLPPVICSSVNGQVLSELGRAPDLTGSAALMREVRLVSADGQPLVFASRLLGMGGLRERCATTDLFHDIADIAVAERLSFYLLGATADENRKAVENVRRRYPELSIVGHRSGYFDSIEDERLAVEQINDLNPDIVWVALGFPRELEFCIRWRHALTNVGVLKTSGGLFNFLSGARRRAPAWMQFAGLEWAYRTYLEPRRLFVRYATTNLHAAWLLMTKTERRHEARSALTGG